jgi:hypothetical protein
VLHTLKATMTCSHNNHSSTPTQLNNHVNQQHPLPLELTLGIIEDPSNVSPSQGNIIDPSNVSPSQGNIIDPSNVSPSQGNNDPSNVSPSQDSNLQQRQSTPSTVAERYRLRLENEERVQQEAWDRAKQRADELNARALRDAEWMELNRQQPGPLQQQQQRQLSRSPQQQERSKRKRQTRNANRRTWGRQAAQQPA